MRKQEIVAAALAAGVAFGACAAPAMAADKVTINFVSWGGAYAKSQIKAMIEPYQQQNPDVKINVIDYNGGLAQIKAQIEAKNVVWQIVDMTPQRGVAGCDEGILETDRHQPSWRPPMTARRRPKTLSRARSWSVSSAASPGPRWSPTTPRR